MDLPGEVRPLLEFSIELLVIGGGLPSLVLQRPAWLREIRDRYSIWRFIPWLGRLNGLTITPLLLGLILFWHIGLAAGWRWAFWGRNAQEIQKWFYVSLALSLVLVGWLWYQVLMTSFPQVAQRLFWLAWYKQKRLSSTPLSSPHTNLKQASEKPTMQGPLWARGVAYFLAVLAPETTIVQALQDLGRLGANTQTPQETILILQALYDLAKVIPIETSATHAPISELCAATTASLWPLNSSNWEAFHTAITIFAVLLPRWRDRGEKEPSRQEGTIVAPSSVPKPGMRAESPLLPHLYTLGRALLTQYEDLLRQSYLDLFRIVKGDKRIGENHGAARLLFLLGVQAARNHQWEAVLYIAEKAHEYHLCDLEQWSVHPHGQPEDALVEWADKCEATAWYLGLLAYVAHHAKGTRPWVERYLRRDFGLDEGDVDAQARARRLLRSALDYSAQFFTRLTLEPETAEALDCLRCRLFPEEEEGPLPALRLCDSCS